MVIGDYNAKTGDRRGPIREDKEKEKEGESRNSRDKVINREGRVLINKIEERGWTILNGSYNNERGWTYPVSKVSKRRSPSGAQNETDTTNHIDRCLEA